MSVSYSLKDLDPALFEKQKTASSSKTDILESNASLGEPIKVGHYSLSINKENEHRTVLFDQSKLTYLHLPPKSQTLSYDLSESYNKYKRINWCAPANVKLDEFLQWILRNRDLLTTQDERKPLGTDFITYRGVLTKIMVTPFVRDKWLIGASNFKGSIYLCPFFEEEKFDEYRNEMSFGGYRFEHYITRTNPLQTDLVEPFSSMKDEFSVVIRTKVQSSTGKNYLLYAAEVDCLESDKTDKNKMKNFCEIKTTRQIHSERQQMNFEKFKLIKWWAQSYLIGVPKIICGYKDDGNVVRHIGTFDVHNIPPQCSQHWSRRQCLNFLQQFLTFVQQVVVEDDPQQVYLFSNETPNLISTRKLLLKNHFQILPEWYISEMEGKLN